MLQSPSLKFLTCQVVDKLSILHTLCFGPVDLCWAECVVEEEKQSSEGRALPLPSSLRVMVCSSVSFAGNVAIRDRGQPGVC